MTDSPLGLPSEPTPNSSPISSSVSSSGLPSEEQVARWLAGLDRAIGSQTALGNTHVTERLAELSVALPALVARCREAEQATNCPHCDGSAMVENYRSIDVNGHPGYVACSCKDGTLAGAYQSLRSRLSEAEARLRAEEGGSTFWHEQAVKNLSDLIAAESLLSDAEADKAEAIRQREFAIDQCKMFDAEYVSKADADSRLSSVRAQVEAKIAEESVYWGIPYHNGKREAFAFVLSLLPEGTK